MKTYQYIQFGLVAAELFAFLSGVYYYQKVKNSYWKWFVFYLGFIVAGEIAGLSTLYYFNNGSLSRDIYNFVIIPCEFLFFIWLFWRYMKKERKFTIWPLIAAVLYAVSWIVNTFFLPDLTIWFFEVSYLTGVVVILVLVMLFFIRFVNADEVTAYKNNILFWVSLGLLVFYLVTSPYFALRTMLYRSNKELFWVYYYVQFAANYFMYIIFAFSFKWAKQQ